MITPYLEDTAGLRRAFAGFPSGVVALAATVDGEPTVLVASSFTVGVSLEPPLVMVAVQRSSTTWPILARAETIGVSVLGEGHRDLTRQIAGKDKASRLAGIDTYTDDDGAIYMMGAPIWMSCAVETVYPAGDHEAILLRVRGLGGDEAHRPLVWHQSQFMQLAG